MRSSSFSSWFPHPLHCSPRHRTKRCCLAGTLPYKLWSQSERLLLHLCTINCLLMGAKSICSNNLYSSSCAQLKAEPGVLSSAPESFLCQDPTRQGFHQTPTDDLTPLLMAPQRAKLQGPMGEPAQPVTFLSTATLPRTATNPETQKSSLASARQQRGKQRRP